MDLNPYLPIRLQSVDSEDFNFAYLDQVQERLYKIFPLLKIIFADFESSLKDPPPQKRIAITDCDQPYC